MSNPALPFATFSLTSLPDHIALLYSITFSPASSSLVLRCSVVLDLHLIFFIMTNMPCRFILKILKFHCRLTVTFIFSPGHVSALRSHDPLHRDQSLHMRWHRDVTVPTFLGPRARQTKSGFADLTRPLAPRAETPEPPENNLRSPTIYENCHEGQQRPRGHLEVPAISAARARVLNLHPDRYPSPQAAVRAVVEVHHLRSLGVPHVAVLG